MMPPWTHPNDRRRSRPLPGQFDLFAPREVAPQLPMAPAVTDRVPASYGPVAGVPPTPRRSGGASDFALARHAFEDRLPFGARPQHGPLADASPAPPPPPETPAWAWAELPDGSRFAQAASVDAIPLTSALIDTFEREASAAIRAVDHAVDYDALVAALDQYDRLRPVRDAVFDRALHDALRDDGSFRAQSIAEWMEKRRGSMAPRIHIDDPPHRTRSDVVRFNDALRFRGSWVRDARARLRGSLDGAREAVRILGDGAVTLLVRQARNVEPAGFPVRIEGIESTMGAGKLAGHDRGELAVRNLAEGLRRFRQRAGRVLPGLLRSVPPFELSDVACGNRSALPSAAAHYSVDGGRRVIRFCAEALVDTHPDVVAHYVAHEMGHHLWKTVLSDGARAEWWRLVRENSPPLDLPYLLSRWAPGESELALVRELRRDRPELAAIVEGVFEHGELQGITSREELADLMQRGGRPHAHARSITPYALKNEEEAFCEALGLLVSRGPAALHDDVAQWLRTVVPSARTMANGGVPPADTVDDRRRAAREGAAFYRHGADVPPPTGSCDWCGAGGPVYATGAVLGIGMRRPERVCARCARG